MGISAVFSKVSSSQSFRLLPLLPAHQKNGLNFCSHIRPKSHFFSYVQGLVLINFQGRCDFLTGAMAGGEIGNLRSELR